MVLDEIIGNFASNITNYIIILGFVALIGKLINHYFQKKLDNQAQDHEDDMKSVCKDFSDLKEDFKHLENIVLTYLLKGKME